MERQSDMDSWILNLKRVTALIAALNGKNELDQEKRGRRDERSDIEGVAAQFASCIRNVYARRFNA